MEEKDLSERLVKEYIYWSVYVHENQGYLGRCVIWCKREDALDLTDATSDEQKELFLILRELKGAVTNIFHPDWFNYAFLGNETTPHHLHGHLVPRYKKPKQFMEITFEDKLYGHHYKTDWSFVTPKTVILEVKSLMQKSLKNT